MISAMRVVGLLEASVRARPQMSDNPTNKRLDFTRDREE